LRGDAAAVETHEAVEELKSLIIEHDLPQTDMAIFGVTCPYCGKSDRIRRLEPPEDLDGAIDSTKREKYTVLWQRLNPSAARLGICKFCLNPLELNLREGTAKALDRP